MQSNPDLLVEDLEDLLVRTPLEHVTVRLERLDRLPARLRRTQVHVDAFGGTVVGGPLVRRDDVLDLAHEDVDASVEALRDGVVEGHLEALLLAYDGVHCEVSGQSGWKESRRNERAHGSPSCR